MLKKILAPLLFLVIACQSGPVISQDTGQKLNELMEAYVKTGKFNGSVLVAKNGKVLLEKGYGLKNAGNHSALTAHSIFQVGSVTKQFTSTIILKLVELKKLSLQDKLSKFYRGFPHGDSITIEHLLTHTSGIFNYTNDETFMKTEAVKPANEEKILAVFKDKELDFPPGSKWNYSNSGYCLLGYIISKVSGMSYEKAVRKYIFEPLQMNSSGFDFAHLQDPEKSTGYDVFSDTEKKVSGIVDSSVSFSAGAVYSSVEDLYKWHQGLQNYKIITKALAEKAYTPVQNKYGYGWIIDSVFGKRVISHGGGIFGFRSNIARITEDDVCIVLLCNIPANDLQSITQSIFSILYDKSYTLPKEKKEIRLSEEVLKKYTGSYEINPQFILEITLENGKLMAQPSGQGKLEIFAEKEDHFFLKAVEIELEFVADASGKIEKVYINQQGKKQTGVKKK